MMAKVPPIEIKIQAEAMDKLTYVEDELKTLNLSLIRIISTQNTLIDVLMSMQKRLPVNEGEKNGG